MSAELRKRHTSKRVVNCKGHQTLLNDLLGALGPREWLRQENSGLLEAPSLQGTVCGGGMRSMVFGDGLLRFECLFMLTSCANLGMSLTLSEASLSFCGRQLLPPPRVAVRLECGHAHRSAGDSAWHK